MAVAYDSILPLVVCSCLRGYKVGISSFFLSSTLSAFAFQSRHYRHHHVSQTQIHDRICQACREACRSDASLNPSQAICRSLEKTSPTIPPRCRAINMHHCDCHRRPYCCNEEKGGRSRTIYRDGHRSNPPTTTKGPRYTTPAARCHDGA